MNAKTLREKLRRLRARLMYSMQARYEKEQQRQLAGIGRPDMRKSSRNADKLHRAPNPFAHRNAVWRENHGIPL